MTKRTYSIWLVCLALACFAGCPSSDERLVRATEQADARQADQNQSMAHLATEQQHVQTVIELGQQQLDQERTKLDDERRELAAARVREPIIAGALASAALLVACCAPLVFAVFVLWGARRPQDDDLAIGELLIEELTADKPLLLPRPSALAHEPQAADGER